MKWDGETAIIGGGSGDLLIWDLHRGVHMRRITAHRGPVTVMAVNESADLIATGGEDRKVIVWATRNKED